MKFVCLGLRSLYPSAHSMQGFGSTLSYDLVSRSLRVLAHHFLLVVAQSRVVLW